MTVRVYARSRRWGPYLANSAEATPSSPPPRKRNHTAINDFFQEAKVLASGGVLTESHVSRLRNYLGEAERIDGVVFSRKDLDELKIGS